HILLLGFTALIPGAKIRTIFLSTLTFLSLLILTQIYQVNTHPIYATIRPNCELEAIGVSILTTLAGHFYLKRFPFSRHQIFSVLIFYGLPLMATLILHSACKSEWLHVLSCHVFCPFIIPSAYLMMLKKS
ncbi:MAG: hypothetical protein K2Q18_01705, partial [Bdellovibrionales bacterium]|nr:hypothetical protein [Bdellovibrionales bacterium]